MALRASTRSTVALDIGSYEVKVVEAGRLLGDWK